MVKKILCVAEKPSIAKAVAGHLAGGHVNSTSASNGRNGWLKNYTFAYNFPRWGPCEVVMTSVAGHLQSHDFEERFKNWRGCPPEALFSATVNTFIEDDKKHIATNIERNARGAEALFIWTDCDREGEHIGTEISTVAARVNNRLLRDGNIVRARFSNTERQHIIQAARDPIYIDDKQASAVAARIELDLRIGACFTRMQTLSLQAMVQSVDQEVKVISYGSCQFPTLGFVVDRYFQVQNFVPEPFWAIKVMHIKDKQNVKFSWTRNRLFDRMTVVVLFERCLTEGVAKVVKVQDRPASKWKPLPLTTVELQKMGSRYLRMDSRQVMKVAETLYQKGWISYPRTETDQFDRDMDLRRLIDKQTQSPAWGQHAQGLMDGNFSNPRNGRNNDKAHPPIHPVNYVNPATLQPDEKRVHEFVVRRFLACCSEDAKGMRSEVEISYGDERFKAAGLTVLERNYLEVYPYEKWTSTDELPRFEVGETFKPTEANITDGKTVKPGYLTEPELIGLMDANGIGTDATMAEHIATIKERRYVMTQKTRRAAGAEEGDEAEEGGGEPDVPAGAGRGRGRGRAGRGSGAASGRGAGGSGVDEFIPTTLGVALYDGYEKMGLETSLTKPFLRKEMELKMKAICDGRMEKQAVIDESLTMYREVYVRTQEHMGVLRASIQRYVLGQSTANGV